MAQLLLFGIKHRPLPIRFAVVLELERVAADEYLGWSDKAIQRMLIIFEQTLVGIIGRVTRHDQQNRNRTVVTTRSFDVIGQILKDQALIERTEGSGHLAEVIRRANDQAVRFSDRVEHRR